MLSTVKTLKNDEFFRVFAIFLAKTGDFYYGKKDFNFMLSFCHFGAKTGLEPLYYLLFNPNQMNKGGRVYIYLAALIDEIKLFSCQ